MNVLTFFGILSGTVLLVLGIVMIIHHKSEKREALEVAITKAHNRRVNNGLRNRDAGRGIRADMVIPEHWGRQEGGRVERAERVERGYEAIAGPGIVQQIEEAQPAIWDNPEVQDNPQPIAIHEDMEQVVEEIEAVDERAFEDREPIVNAENIGNAFDEEI